MKYLLDVNALVAWSQQRAPHHDRFHSWASTQGLNELATCAHSELGFIRVSMQVFGDSLAEAQTQLAAWSATAAKTSDAYLTQVAAGAGLTLATFDRGIPGSVLI